MINPLGHLVAWALVEKEGPAGISFYLPFPGGAVKAEIGDHRR